jgi:signal peptidase I
MHAPALERTAARRSRLRALCAHFARFVVLSVAFALVLTLARGMLGDQYLVPTASMWPTIVPGDHIFVAKAAYGLRLPWAGACVGEGGPAVGDVIVFADPRGGDTPLVKRVVALAGQTVALRRGVLHVDGAPQRLEALGDGRVVEHLGEAVHDVARVDDEDYGPVTVPGDAVFVMGDNRAVSLDSRSLGAISTRLVRGRVLGAVLRYERGLRDCLSGWRGIR